MTDTTTDTGGRARLLRIGGVVLGALSLAAVVALAVVLLQSQDRARADAIERFEERGDVVAKILSGSVAQSVAETVRDAPKVMSGDVEVAELKTLEGLGDAGIPYSAVLDAEGEVITAYPETATVATTEETQAAVRDALEGTATMTGVQEGESGRVIEYVIPFTTTDGEQRIYYVGYDAELLGQSVSSAITQALDSDEGAAYLLDEDGAVLLSIGDGEVIEEVTPRISAAAEDDRVAGVVGDVRYELSEVDGTALVFAHALPESAVLSGLPNPTWARIAIVSLALALLATFALAARAMRDAHRLDAARREADDANAAKGQLLAHVSHELKTPIAVIRGFAGMLHNADLSDREDGFVDRIDESGRHLYRLADDLLEVSRIEAGRVTLALERIDARLVVDEVLELAAPLAQERRIRLEPPTVREAVPPILADQMRLRQVLLNLLSNAIKYNRDEGVVHVDLVADGEAVTVAISDTGRGIAPEDVDRLFQPFERLSADRDSVRGTGLGLCVTKGLVEAMGGTITVSSIPGSGSTFAFALPASPVGDITEYVRAEPVAQAQAGRIVYIDDSDASLELAARIVDEERPGLVMRTAGDGTSGLELIRAEATDLLLLDLNLPDMHGEAVLALVRSDPDTATLPVLVVSADSTSRDVTRLLRTGADAYLTKPLDVDQFLGVIDRLLASRS